MGYIIVIIITIVLSIVVMSGCKKDDEHTNTKPYNSQTVEPVRIKDIEITREKISKKLANLKAPLKREQIITAMCYAVAAPPKTAEYICPECGYKTQYSYDASESNTGNRYNTITTIAWEIDTCRRYIEMINQTEISLDESQFCSHCSPEINEPKLVLVIEYPDLKYRYENIQSADLELILDFLTGKELDDENQPIYDKKKHLSELLGIEPEGKK